MGGTLSCMGENQIEGKESEQNLDEQVDLDEYKMRVRRQDLEEQTNSPEPPKVPRMYQNGTVKIYVE
jgi:hypothetical protein